MTAKRYLEGCCSGDGAGDSKFVCVCGRFVFICLTLQLWHDRKCLFCSFQRQLQLQTAKGPEEKPADPELPTTETKNQSIAQIIYADNRVRFSFAAFLWRLSVESIFGRFGLSRAYSCCVKG